MHTRLLKSPEDTAKLAEFLATHAQVGNCFLLSGDLGVGKSFFARSFILHYTQHDLHVQSPTFPIVQIYDHGAVPIWHCDLYRLNTEDEILELGLDEAFSQAITLIEWPERLGRFKPKNYMHLVFNFTSHPLEREVKIIEHPEKK